MDRHDRPSVTEPAAYRHPISRWPLQDRPREKLFAHGPRSLSDAELIAILFRSGRTGVTAVDLARRILGGGRTLREISAMTADALRRLGIGPSHAAVLAASFELARRLESAGEEQPLVRGPEDVVKVFGPLLRDRAQEEFWVLPLSSANRLHRPAQVTVGTLNASLVHPRECFRPAIERSAASVIFVHNHPSGNPEPSEEDVAITRQLADAGRVLGIPVHDHIVIAGASYTSLAERGLIP
jgi:DNA repair protein RadC